MEDLQQTVLPYISSDIPVDERIMTNHAWAGMIRGHVSFAINCNIL